MEMDVNLRAILIGAGVAVLCLTIFLSSCAYQNHTCKMEAIKAGMKAAEVSQACHV